MLSYGSPIKSAEQAEFYYQQDEYYLQEKGEWFGKGAAELSLEGRAERADFANIIRGRDRDGNRLTGGNEENRRVGIDLTFSATKSVSILAIIDERIKDAHESTTKKTLAHIENNYLQTRDQAGGKVKVVDTNNMVAYLTTHQTSRELDPQLHTHSVIMNMTKTPDGEWRALHFDAFYQDRVTNYGGVYYRNELIKELRTLGYEIEVTDRTKGLFEVKGFSKELIDDYSKRREQIEGCVKDIQGRPEFKGWSDAKLAEYAARQTRKVKEFDPDRRNIREEWLSEIIEKGYDLNAIKEKCQAAAKEMTHFHDLPKNTYDIIREAAAGISGTEAVFTKEQVLEVANYLAMGKYTGGEIAQAYEEQTVEGQKVEVVAAVIALDGKEIAAGVKGKVVGRSVEKNTLSIYFKNPATKKFETAIIDMGKHSNSLQVAEKDESRWLVKLGKNAYTTKEMIRLEREIVERVKTGRGTRAAIAEETVRSYLTDKDRQVDEKGGFKYTAGQRSAINLICTNRDVVSLIQGDAGTGKTTMAAAVKEIYEKEGWQVIGMSQTGKASEELQKGSGIITSTIAQFTGTNKEHIKKGRSLWIVDEAGMAGNKDMANILRLADKYDAKVALIGDRKQFMSIAAGRVFKLLQDTGHALKAVMFEVSRQKTDYTRELVSLISNAEGVINKAHVQALKIKYGETSKPVKLIVEQFVQNVMQDKWKSLNYSPMQRAILADLLGKDVKEIGRKDLAAARELLERQVVRGVNIDKAFGVLGANGRLHEITDRNQRLTAVAEKYIEQALDAKHALVITALNRDRKDMNATIREVLVQKGKVEEGHSFNVLSPAGINGSMRLMADAYQEGQVTVLLGSVGTIDGKSVAGGAKGEIVGRNVEKNTITIQYRNGKTKKTESAEIEVGKFADKLSVYQKESLPFGVGERVVFLKNDEKLGVQNGLTGSVKKMDQHGNCVVDIDGDGKNPAKTVKFNMGGLTGKGGNSYNYLNHGYAVTEYKSQGQTVDTLIWHVEADKKFQNMTTTNSFYVAMTRERHDVLVVASNIDELKELVKEEQRKMSVYDFLKPKQETREKLDGIGHDPAAVKAALDEQIKAREHVAEEREAVRTAEDGKSIAPEATKDAGRKEDVARHEHDHGQDHGKGIGLK